MKYNIWINDHKVIVMNDRIWAPEWQS